MEKLETIGDSGKPVDKIKKEIRKIMLTKVY